MAYTTINKSTSYFNTKLYTGDGGTNNAQTGVGFRPDFIWFKRRSGSGNHFAADVVRGTYADGYKLIVPNDTDAEANYTYIKSLDSDGFTLGSNNSNVNGSGETYVAWNWLAGGSQGSSNTDGSTNTIYTSVNTTAGFSISTYTGTGSAATIGHGLGVAPKMIIVKRISSTDSWTVGHDGLGWGKYLRLDTTAAEASNTSTWNNTAPTSTVFSVNHDDTNANGVTFVVYCFAEKTGYSKFGFYSGNANANGSFIYTGFKPAFLIVKATHSSTSESWLLLDSTRQPFNLNSKRIRPDNAGAEDTAAANGVDLLSNGFKIRTNDNRLNGGGQNLIYMAFGQSLVGSNDIPCTAR
jgi:hypothetical protein